MEIKSEEMNLIINFRIAALIEGVKDSVKESIGPKDIIELMKEIRNETLEITKYCHESIHLLLEEKAEE